MRLDFPPKYTETIGSVKIHSLQKVYEIDSGYTHGTTLQNFNSQTMAFDNNTLSKIFKHMAVVIPVKDEKIKSFGRCFKRHSKRMFDNYSIK